MRALNLLLVVLLALFVLFTLIQDDLSSTKTLLFYFGPHIGLVACGLPLYFCTSRSLQVVWSTILIILWTTHLWTAYAYQTSSHYYADSGAWLLAMLTLAEYLLVVILLVIITIAVTITFATRRHNKTQRM